MRRLLLALLVGVFVAAALLAGCKGTKKGTGGSDAPPTKPSPAGKAAKSG